MFSSTQTTLNRQQLYSVTFRILNANSLHFIPISLLFLPLTFSAYAVIKFYSSSGSTDVTTMFDPFNLLLIKTIIASSQNLLTVKTLVTVLTFIGFVILPTVAGVALITYSTNQAIQLTRKPITFSTTVKSLSHSYIPLLHTFNAGLITLIIIFLAFTLSPIAVTEAIKALGFHFRVFEFSIFINTIVSYALVMTTLFFVVIWGSAAAITVLESKSGFEALRQSSNQSMEFRRHSFYVVFLTGYFILPALSCSSILQKWGPTTANWMLILQVGGLGAMYLQSSLMILLYVVMNTVLYLQCKVASDKETATTIVKGEVSGEYVRLVVNDDDGDEEEVVNESANRAFNYILCYSAIVFVIFRWVLFLAPRS